jgi:hypothetical protein
MSAAIDEMARWDVGMLDQLQQSYRAAGDMAGVAIVDAAIAKKELVGVPQTADVANCGRLFRQRRYDADTGRITFEYTGDIAEFLKPFTNGAITGKVNRSLFTGENSPEARTTAAEHRAIFADGLAAVPLAQGQSKCPPRPRSLDATLTRSP